MTTPRHATAAESLPDDRRAGRLASVIGHRLFFASAVTALLLVGTVLIALSVRSAAEQRLGPSVANGPAVAGSATPTAGSAAPSAEQVPAGTATETSKSDDNKPGAKQASRSAKAVAPTEITIPAIGVDTSVIRLGLAADHTVEVPPYDKADDVGWYTQSPTPGAVGPAVLIGHIDSPSGPAVFARMAQLKHGEKVRIKRADGTVAVFTVDRLQTYAKSSFPTRAVYGDTDTAQLRLITCGGSYVRSNGGYQANTIAFAHLDSIETAQQ
jgi:sortase (surface protein transpeptidase)